MPNNQTNDEYDRQSRITSLFGDCGSQRKIGRRLQQASPEVERKQKRYRSAQEPYRQKTQTDPLVYTDSIKTNF